MIEALIQVFRIVKSFDTVDFWTFFELNNGAYVEGSQMEIKSKQMQITSEKMFFSVSNYQ